MLKDGPFRVLLKNRTWDPYDEYKIKIKVGELRGGIPMNEKLMEGWINANNRDLTDEQKDKLKNATKEELVDLSDEKIEKSSTTFKQDENGLYIEGRCIKACLKEAANIIKDVAPTSKSKTAPKGLGIKALKSKVADRVFVKEEKVYLGRKEPDGYNEQPIHVIGPLGPRSSIKRSYYCKDVELEFTILRFCDNTVPESTLGAVLMNCQQIGLGSDRSQGAGVFEVLDIQKIKDANVERE